MTPTLRWPSGPQVLTHGARGTVLVDEDVALALVVRGRPSRRGAAHARARPAVRGGRRRRSRPRHRRPRPGASCRPRRRRPPGRPRRSAGSGISSRLVRWALGHLGEAGEHAHRVGVGERVAQLLGEQQADRAGTLGPQAPRGRVGPGIPEALGGVEDPPEHLGGHLLGLVVGVRDGGDGDTGGLGDGLQGDVSHGRPPFCIDLLERSSKTIQKTRNWIRTASPSREAVASGPGAGRCALTTGSTRSYA